MFYVSLGFFLVLFIRGEFLLKIYVRVIGSFFFVVFVFSFLYILEKFIVCMNYFFFLKRFLYRVFVLFMLRYVLSFERFFVDTLVFEWKVWISFY